MKARVVALVALAAAVTLTSVAAAGPNAAKQRVEINMKIYPQQTFVLMAAGALKRDSGSIATEREAQGRGVMRNGHSPGSKGRSRFENGPNGSKSPTRTPASATHLVSPSAPGRSCAGQAGTPRSPEVVEAAMRGSVVAGSHAKRAS